MKYGCVVCDWVGDYNETETNDIAYVACPICGAECQPEFEPLN